MSGRHLPDFDCIGQYLHYRETSRRASEPRELPGSRLTPGANRPASRHPAIGLSGGRRRGTIETDGPDS